MGRATWGPTSWNRTALNKIHKPVRITGQLFFDASHLPCSGGIAGSGDPARCSNWEIHPVYAVDVCKNASLSACSFDNASVWVPLDQLP